MSHPLDFDLLRSVLQFLDRKQLSLLSAGSNQRIHSLIGREFGNTPPYFLFAWLRYFHNYIYKTKQGNLCRIHEITEQSKSDDDFNKDEFFAFLANCKFIRSYITSINPCSEMPLDFLKPICHIWTGQNLNLVCDQIPLSSELYQMISTSAGNLTLAFPGAFSVLGEPFIQNDRYSYIRLSFDELHLPNDEFPYISNIIQFLFSSDVNSVKHLSMKTRICQPSVRTQIYSAIKQRFLSAANILHFTFDWVSSDRSGWETNCEVILNTQTHQSLIYKIDISTYTNTFSFSLVTLL